MGDCFVLCYYCLTTIINAEKVCITVTCDVLSPLPIPIRVDKGVGSGLTLVVNRWNVVTIFILMVVMGGLVEWDRWVFLSSLGLFSLMCVKYLMDVCKKVSMSFTHVMGG